MKNIIAAKLVILGLVLMGLGVALSEGVIAAAGVILVVGTIYFVIVAAGLNCW